MRYSCLTAFWEGARAALSQDPSGNSPPNARVGLQPVSIFLCPTDGRQIGTQGSTIQFALTSYVGVAGTGVGKYDGVFHQNYAVRLTDISDGTSCTLMIGERPPGPHGLYGGWYGAEGYSVCPLAQILSAGTNLSWPSEASNCSIPLYSFRAGQIDNACDVNHFWSLHPGGANFAFADGSVHFIPYSQAAIMPALATRAGGEVVDFD